jgi:hypothetical protein
MARSSPSPAPLLVLGAAVLALSAAPALATEGPPGPPSPGPFGTPVPPLVFPPIGPSPRTGARRTIASVRILPRRVRRGHHARLVVRLRSAARLRVVMTRATSGHRVRVLRAPARGKSVSVRLPSRAHGRALRPGRYRIRVIAIDAAGRRMGSVQRTLIVRRAGR